ncbi:MAG: hydrogenase iron-sulfur subunit [Candidatus Freyarchaeota archaeon]
MSGNGEFKPRIIGIFCNWCSYAGADMAGTSRMQYPPNLRIIRVMCSSRVDPQFVLKAFELGADGVLVAGCHPGDCHYITGNYRAEERIMLLSKLIEELGIEPERLRLEWISASEGNVLVEVMNDFVEKLKELGPSPLRSSNE